MVVEFRGAPPHDLGTAELATVHAADEHIEVELHILDPIQFRKRCLLTRDEALQGVGYFLEHRARNPQFPWIEMLQAYNLGE